MIAVELSAELALLAALCSALQAVSVEYGLDNGDCPGDRSPALTAAFLSIVVSVVVFWALLVARGLPTERIPIRATLPSSSQACSILRPFVSCTSGVVDRIGARISAAIISVNPAVATVLALSPFGGPFTLLTAAGLVSIIAGAAILQITGSSPDAENDLLVGELASIELRDVSVPAAAMVLLGVSFVLVNYGLDGYSDPLLGTAVGQRSALVAFVVLFGVSKGSRRRAYVRDRTALAAFVIAGLFVAGDWLAWFSALQIGDVVTVVPLSNTYLLFIVAISYLAALQVPKSLRVIAGIVSIVLGATLMQLS